MTESQVKADIIIPTFNQADYTLRCLDSIEYNTVPGAARIIWVDNGSEPSQRAAVQKRLARMPFEIQRVFVNSNLGFVKATNCGLALSTAPVVIFLNNDTEVCSGWLEKLIEPIEKWPTVGMVGPRSSSPHQWQGRQPEEHDEKGYKKLWSDGMLSFFCVAIRRKVVEQVGYLPEDYGVGLADDDEYCERVKRAGWVLIFRYDMTVKHWHRTTFDAVYGKDGWKEIAERNLAHFKERWAAN